MTTIALSTIVLLAYHLWRSRCHIALLERSCNVERQRGDYWRKEAERKQALIDEYIECADLMNDCNVELEQRNLWLESRRHVILRRWFRRREPAKQLHWIKVRRL